MKPHVHADVIRAFADGATIQVCYLAGEWKDEAYPHFDAYVQYRVKPEKKWPDTTMTYEQLETAYSGAGGINSWDNVAARVLANEAIAHACETGQVVPADKVREIEAKAREEGVKEGSKRNDDRDLLMKIQALKEVGTAAYGHIDRLMNGDAK